MEAIQEKILALFSRLRDPRVAGRSKYAIKDILLLSPSDFQALLLPDFLLSLLAGLVKEN